jgi:hypothetical protein
VCTRCLEPKDDDGNLMHPACEEDEAADALAALRSLAAEKEASGEN